MLLTDPDRTVVPTASPPYTVKKYAAAAAASHTSS
jgi:hypothetical protein